MFHFYEGCIEIFSLFFQAHHMLDFNRDLTGPEVFPTVLPARVCVCVWPLPIVAVCIKEQAVTSDQEAYHSCFQDLISRARAKLPLGSQFSFFLIGALIRSGGGKKHIVFAHLKA